MRCLDTMKNSILLQYLKSKSHSAKAKAANERLKDREVCCCRCFYESCIYVVTCRYNQTDLFAHMQCT